MEVIEQGSYPLLPLRDTVIFPHTVAPLFVGRKKSIAALEKGVAEQKYVVLATQKQSDKEDPTLKDLYRVGVIAKVLQLLRLPDGTLKVLVEAIERVKIVKLSSSKILMEAKIEKINIEEEILNLDTEASIRALLDCFEEYVQLNKKISSDIFHSVASIKDPAHFIDVIASHVCPNVDDRYVILEALSLKKRVSLLFNYIQKEISVLNTEKKIQSRVKEQIEKTQRDYYLNEKMKAIQKELNDGDSTKADVELLEDKLKVLKLKKDAEEKIKGEIKKLKMMNPMSAESSVVRNYIDTVLSLPWNNYTKTPIDLKKAKQILDHDHYGLDKIKDRILEYLAVHKRTNKLKSPIICFVGPPGVGKTSLAKSIAECTDRAFAKFSLGGVRDEAEIRGHRRTYLGAMPGKIIQLIKKAKTANPVMLLDEIDKMGTDYRGDPASALLEVLDPEQNNQFLDHYLEVEFDLSNVLFIATANSYNIPRPLLDRMEIINLSGYTEFEKLEIAKKHLLSKQKEAHGLKEGELIVDDEAILDIIRYYTREAGVRSLEKEIAKIARKSLKKILEGKIDSYHVTTKNLKTLLGVKKYDYGKMEDKDSVGVTTGLAYTEVGGDLLSIESVLLPGRSDIKLTGKLGQVMQESASTAFSYFKSQAPHYGVKPTKFQKKDIHIHVPEGATPKDGPSAGVAMFTSIVSVMTGIPVRKTVAMTGEITLRGRVLPIGGLKEKLLAALRGGIKTVLIPKANKKDLSEIPKEITRDLEIIPIAHADEALEIALTELPKEVEWTEADELAFMANQQKLGNEDLRAAH